MFPDYLSVSYDYGARTLLDEYFHFYSIGPKVQNKGNIYKNLNNCMPQLFFHALYVAKKIAVSVWVILAVY